MDREKRRTCGLSLIPKADPINSVAKCSVDPVVPPIFKKENAKER
jgi:hypothetical protein